MQPVSFFVSVLAIVFALASNHAWAESAAHKKKIQRTVNEEPVQEPRHAVRVNLGPGIAVAGGASAFALNFGATKQVFPQYPIQVGGDLGIDFFGSATIQLLATGYYLIALPNTPQARWIAGLSMGPGITTGIGGNILFELLFRVGAEMDVARNFVVSFEPKFGILGANFIFLPQLNGIFSL